MIVTYTIKTPEIKPRAKFKAIALILILLTCLSAIFLETTYLVASLIGLVIIVLWYNYLNTSREDPSPYWDQKLIFETSNIVIGNQIFVLKELKNIKILINDFDGEIITTTEGSKIILNGTDNQLSFTYLKRNISLSFYIMSEIQKQQFKILFDAWYKEQLPFYEGNSAGRTYLLDMLNYQEIQEFKARYRLT